MRLFSVFSAFKDTFILQAVTPLALTGLETCCCLWAVLSAPDTVYTCVYILTIHLVSCLLFILHFYICIINIRIFTNNMNISYPHVVLALIYLCLYDPNDR